MKTLKRLFRLYSAWWSPKTRITEAEGAAEALQQLGINPDEVLVEHASGDKCVFKYDGKTYVLTDEGYV